MSGKHSSDKIYKVIRKPANVGMLQESEIGGQEGHQDKPLVKIGVIGCSSVGKSTLTKALGSLKEERLYEPSTVVEAVATETVATETVAPTPLRHSFPEQQTTKADVTYVTKHFFCHHYELPAFEDGNEHPRCRTLAQLTAVILVLDVQAAITTATRNLLRLVQEAGIPLVVPFLNKCDLAPWMARVDEIEEAVETALVDAGLPAVTPIWGAALPALVEPASTWNETVEQFLLHLDYHLKVFAEAQLDNQLGVTPLIVTPYPIGT